MSENKIQAKGVRQPDGSAAYAGLHVKVRSVSEASFGPEDSVGPDFVVFEQGGLWAIAAQNPVESIHMHALKGGTTLLEAMRLCEADLKKSGWKSASGREELFFEGFVINDEALTLDFRIGVL